MALSLQELDHVLHRFPSIELPYVSFSHKKVSTSLQPSVYPMKRLIPYGPKYFLWYTFHRHQNGYFWMELDKQKRVISAEFNSMGPTAKGPLYWGTVLMGTRPSRRPNTLIVEEILSYHGVLLHKETLGVRMKFLKQWFIENRYITATATTATGLHFSVPKMMSYEDNVTETAGIHHIEYCSLNQHVSHLGFVVEEIKGVTTGVQEKGHGNQEPQETKEKRTTANPRVQTFWVRADFQVDIYHLSPLEESQGGQGGQGDGGGGCECLAYIPNLLTSRLMNQLFRRISDSIDAIEESDNEADEANEDEFENVRLDKRVKMECEYSPKFKKWIPLRVME